MSWMTTGDIKRLKDEAWALTIEDLCDLMSNYKTASTIGKQQEFAARAIDMVLGNLERRELIEDRFFDIRETK